MARRADPFGSRQRGLARARAQVDDPVAGLELRQIEHGFGNRAQPGLKRGRPEVPGERRVLPLLPRRLLECDRVEVLHQDPQAEYTPNGCSAAATVQ